MPQITPDTAAREEIFHKVCMAGALFHDKFTLGMLEQVDPLLHEAVADQYEMFFDAYSFEDEGQCVLHGEAMVRGWVKAILRMEEVVIEKAVTLFPEARIVRSVPKPWPWGKPAEPPLDVD